MEFKLLLKSKGISGAKLARQLNLSRSSICNWVAKKRTPTLATISKISEILDVSLDTVAECFIGGKNGN